MQKPLIFISHITEEKEIALSLKQLLEAAFIGMMDVFVSSDPLSITLGSLWLDNITEALSRCAVEIIVVSPASVKRPWINFEAGAGWIRKIPVVPLCHSGMTPIKLPAPLNALQSATATDLQQLKLVLPVLARALGSAVPPVDFAPFVERVRQFESDSNLHIAFSREMPGVEVDGLLPHELATFVAIAETSDFHEPISIWAVKQALEKRYRPLAVHIALKMLERKDMVIISMEDGDSYNREPIASVRISNPGWIWLESNQDKLQLVEVAEQPLNRNYATDEIPF